MRTMCEQSNRPWIPYHLADAGLDKLGILDGSAAGYSQGSVGNTREFMMSHLRGIRNRSWPQSQPA